MISLPMSQKRQVGNSSSSIQIEGVLWRFMWTDTDLNHIQTTSSTTQIKSSFSVHLLAVAGSYE